MAWKTYEGYMKKYPTWLKYLYYGALMMTGSGCTYSIIMNHSEGQASDVVDENQTASPDVSPTLSIPVK